MSAAQQLKFFASKRFVVVGASADPSKFGNKVFQWYLNARLPVTGVNPSQTEVLGQPTVASFADAVAAASEADSGTTAISVSVITPPKITAALIAQIAQFGSAVQAVWFQPGSYDAVTLKMAQEVVPTVIADGWCVLVDGDASLAQAGSSL
ncbi:CoA-binding protein [Dipodascopsis tothii]|uniref:CoA-binding protein n=1 Tax=Dipodascopsis tothii TaxID=44089 RepID=UPI0034CD40BA